MILGNIFSTDDIEGLNPQFAKAFDWIRKNCHAAHSLGVKRVEIDGDNIFVNIDSPEMKNADNQVIELHRRYIDIHVPISASETIGWKHSSELVSNLTPYNEEKDFAFYADKPSTYLTLHPGDFCIMYPTDGHAPIIGKGHIDKLCIKIKY